MIIRIKNNPIKDKVKVIYEEIEGNYVLNEGEEAN